MVEAAPATFQNNSQGAATYKWTFGDGATATIASPTHTYAKEGTYTVTLRAYGTHQDSSLVSQVLTVVPNILARAPIKILGNYDYSLVTVGYYNSPTPKTTQSKGTLTVTQTGPAAITISKVSTTTSFTYDPDPANSTIYRFHYDDNGGTVLTRGAAHFYPTGDSMHVDLTTLIGLGGSESNTYRCYRRP